MRDGSAQWRGRPPAVWVLAVMTLLGSVLCFASALRPAAPLTPTGLNAWCAVAGVGLAAVLWWPRTRLQGLRVHAVAVAKLFLAYLLVAQAATGEGAMAAAMTTIWIGLYTSAFHPRVVSRAYLVGSAVGLAVAFAANPIIVGAAGAWVVVVLSTVVASKVYSRLLERARRLAVTDHLTGLPNRQGLFQRIDGELRRAARGRWSVALAVIDLDDFKQVNDRDGHLAGDRVLQALAAQLTAALRPVDAVFRMGGDEFLLVLPGMSLEAAAHAVQRMHAASDLAWSYGVVVVGAEEELDLALARADQHMYAHKDASRGNRVPVLRMGPSTTVTLRRNEPIAGGGLARGLLTPTPPCRRPALSASADPR